MQSIIIGIIATLLTFQCATVALAGETADASKTTAGQPTADAQPQPAPAPEATAPATTTTTETAPAPAPQAATEPPAVQTADTAAPATTDEKKEEKKE
jgi:hypothetical protein